MDRASKRRTDSCLADTLCASVIALLAEPIYHTDLKFGGGISLHNILDELEGQRSPCQKA